VLRADTYSSSGYIILLGLHLHVKLNNPIWHIPCCETNICWGRTKNCTTCVEPDNSQQPICTHYLLLVSRI